MCGIVLGIMTFDLFLLQYTYDFRFLQIPVRDRPVRYVKGQQYVPLIALNVSCLYLEFVWRKIIPSI